jgi:2-dehydro-3-deoxygalactonokinase
MPVYGLPDSGAAVQRNRLGTSGAPASPDTDETKIRLLRAKSRSMAGALTFLDFARNKRRKRSGMAWADGFIAVDWGTTNRRGYLLDPGGRLTDEMEDDRGILAVGRHGFDAAVAELKGRLGERPLLMAGMIGSNRGWVEAPYVPCPAGLPELAANLKWVVRDRIAIVPGVSYRDNERADVMRGEEVQLLGAYAEGLVGADALICHPGTHNKWARLRDGRITEFRTIMTGELFNLLREHSILSELLAGPSTPPAASLRINSAAPDAAFEAGVRHGLTHDDLQAASKGRPVARTGCCARAAG